MTYELYHHGILGMRWGVRRYQNKYGALTPAGKKHRAKLEASYDELDSIGALTDKGKKKKAALMKEYKSLTGKSIRTGREAKPEVTETQSNKSGKPVSISGNKSIKEMSNAELQARIDRLNLEQKLISLTPDTRSNGEKFVSTINDKVLTPALLESGKAILKTYITKTVSKALGLKEDSVSKDAKATAEKDVKDAAKQTTKTAEEFKQTVEGESRSAKKYKETKAEASSVIDGVWKEVTNPVTPESQKIGIDYVQTLLLEDKHKN